MRNIIIVLFITLLAFGCSGCCTTARIDDPTVAGLRAVERLGQLDSELERIERRFRDELERASTASGDIRELVSEVFRIAYGLCDEIDRIRDEISE